MGFFFFKQKTAYEIYQCDWSSDVCSSDLKRRRLWHRTCVKFACQTTGFLENILTLFSSGMSPDPEQDPKHFQRQRKLPFERLLTFVLHLVGGDTKGVDIKSGLFFKMARRSGVWLNAQQVTRSAVTKARKKLSWKVFRRVFSSVVGLAYQHWPQDAASLWHGMSVFAIDGSKFTLPASHEIRDSFDPNASLRNAGQGHYPMALVSTAFRSEEHTSELQSH